MSVTDDGTVASLRALLTDPRVQSLAGLGDVLIYRTDLATGLTVWTASLLHRFGYHVDSIGTHIAWWLERTHPDDVGMLMSFLDDAVAGQRDEWELAYRFRRADDTWAWVEGRARIVRDTEGKPVATDGVLRDMTRARIAEEALRQREELYRLLTEHAREVVCRHDADGTYRYVSPAVTELTQWTPDELLGRNPYEFFHPDDRERIASEGHAVALRGGTGKIGLVLRFRCKDGSYIWLETLTRPLLDASGHVIGLHSSSRDVTDRRRMEARLLQAQKMDAIGLLASGVAHDFNNLLTVTSANLDLLLSQAHDAATYGLLSEAQAATTSAAVLTRQLMTLGRRELPQRDLIDVAALLDRLTPTLRRLGGARAGLRVQASDDAWIVGSPSQIEQLVLNLVANARDAMRDGGSIIVRATPATLSAPWQARVGMVPAGEWMCLSVEDSGTGIADAVLDHVLEPFFTTKAEGTGMGLGLSTVQAIVSDMGGHLTVSTVEGEGTTVTCWLPPALRPAPRTAPPTTAPVAEPVRARTGCRVLVVDDDAAVLKVAQRVLTTLGFQVHAARGAVEALALIERGQIPDVLLTDVTMPEMSGPELARRLQARLPSLPIAFVSGYAREELLHDGLIGEEYPLVHKPFVAADLGDVMDRLCSRSSRHDSLAVTIE